MKYAGAEWLKANKVNGLSEFGARVADLIGYLYEGIYHVDGIERQDWSGTDQIELKLAAEFSTFDYRNLTTLVLLAHHMAIRIEIRPCTPRLLRLRFSARTRDGQIYYRHPTIEDAIKDFSAACYLPSFEEDLHAEQETGQ